MIKHRSTIAIFSEWQRLAYGRDGSLHAPSRESIAPRKLGRHLSDLFFLEEDESGELIFRLAGTRICALFGRELKAARFLSLWPGRNRPALDELIRQINDLLVPAISYHDGISLAGRSLPFEMLLAPLESHKGRRANLLGAISLLDDVAWAGTDPLVLASLNSVEPLAPDLVFTQEASRPSAMTVNASIRTPDRSHILPRPQAPSLRVIAGGKA